MHSTKLSHSKRTLNVRKGVIFGITHRPVGSNPEIRKLRESFLDFSLIGSIIRECTAARIYISHHFFYISHHILYKHGVDGYTCEAAAIRAVLTYAQHFDADEIAAWPEGEDIVIPKGTSLYYWILDYAKDKGLAYKVIGVQMRITAVVTWEHYGEFDPGKLTEGAWFGWERNGELIDKECVQNREACPRL
jgi:hypothetical protein